jgi:hypothetical protein
LIRGLQKENFLLIWRVSNRDQHTSKQTLIELCPFEKLVYAPRHGSLFFIYSHFHFRSPLSTGFAVNLNYMAKFPNSTMPYKAGYEEDAFLKSIELKVGEIEPKAKDCTEVYVWHTQTTKTKAPLIKISNDILTGSKTNMHALMNFLDEMGVSHTSSSGGKSYF